VWRTIDSGILAITVRPGVAGSARLELLDDPERRDGELLVEMLALGVCGTDREIVDGEYGWPPPGRERLVLGHESLGRVREAPADSGFASGQLVAGMVRRPDPEPCPCCARGELDMCRNGGYRERGIKELDGYGAQLVAVEAEYAVALDPGLGLAGVLVEPASVIAKAWEQIDSVAAQACRPLERVIVAGAGPVGLLAALLGAQRRLEVHVLDRVADGPKPLLTQGLGASYHTGALAELRAEVQPDVIVECTGVPPLIVDAVQIAGPGAIVCLLGVAPRGRTLNVDVGALNNQVVLGNGVVLGSVSANRRHFVAAADALAAADPEWLDGLITRRVALADWSTALERRGDDVKVVVELGA
jgi:threonine dehydrogenase-like Zn-dependent dehydrogenase